MTNPSFRRHFLLLAAMFCASTGVLSTVTAQDGPADLLYSQIKQVEAQMKALEGQTPLPPYTVVQVGTFDVQAGKFDGHGAKHEVDSPIDDSSGPGEPLKPPKNQPTISDPRDGKLSPFNLEIGTPRAQASFAFENNGTETCELSVNSAKNTVAAGAPSVTVDVGTHGNVDWTVACGNGKS